MSEAVEALGQVIWGMHVTGHVEGHMKEKGKVGVEL